MTIPAFPRALRDRLRTRTLPRTRANPLVGGELEWIVLHEDGRPAPIFGAPGRSGTLNVARALACRHGWCERPSERGAPVFVLPCGGVLGWEPGGQIELASAPYASVSELLARLEELDALLRAGMNEQGMTLISVGMDPRNAIDAAPLQASCDRYQRMARYFALIGPAGARMMRQSAALQLSVDPATEGALAWRAANAMAPLLVAMFASSPTYAGADTGCVSFRAENWRSVDVARTGLFPGEDAESEYLDFALRAPVMLLGSPRGKAIGEVRGSPAVPTSRDYGTFYELYTAGVASLNDWDVHLTTLFPEVRPRAHLEIRSADAVPAEQIVAPLTLVCGLLWNRNALLDSIDLLGDPDPADLITAGRSGLRDATLRARATDLIDLALGGCRGLPANVMDQKDVDRAEDIFRVLMAQGRPTAEPPILRARPTSADVDTQPHVHADVVGSQHRRGSAVMSPVT